MEKEKVAGQISPTKAMRKGRAARRIVTGSPKTARNPIQDGPAVPQFSVNGGAFAIRESYQILIEFEKVHPNEMAAIRESEIETTQLATMGVVAIFNENITDYENKNPYNSIMTYMLCVDYKKKIETIVYDYHMKDQKLAARANRYSGDLLGITSSARSHTRTETAIGNASGHADSHASSDAEPTQQRKIKPSRVNKIQLGAWIDPEYKRHLLMVKVKDPSRTTESLVKEALDDLFAKHGVPPVPTTRKKAKGFTHGD
jgi:hypothetical protein